MTDATANNWTHSAQEKDDAVVLPPPVAFGAPVLIADCVTPMSGETLLSLLWKRLDCQP